MNTTIKRAKASHALMVWRLFWNVLYGVPIHLVHLPLYLLLSLTTRTKPARLRLAAWALHLWQTGFAWLFGITVEVEGQWPKGPMLVTPNHTGYLDVSALYSIGSMLFVAKSEIARWTFVGYLFRFTDQIGINRILSVGEFRRVETRVKEAFDAGVKVCAFLEGTSTAGDQVKPFHSPLVQCAVDAGVPILPVGLRWSISQPGGIVSEDVALHRLDQDPWKHWWRVTGLRGIHVKVRIGQPIYGTDRKTVADQAHDQVSRLIKK